MGIRIVLADGEPIGLVLKRFRKILEQNNVPGDERRRQHFTKASEIRRAKQFKRRYRARKATYFAMLAGVQSASSVRPEDLAFWKKSGKP